MTTHFSDGLRSGEGQSLKAGGLGAIHSAVYCYRITPAALLTDNIAAAETVSNGSWTLAAGTGVSTTSIQGVTYLDLGVQRNVRFTGESASTAQVLLTIVGREEVLGVDGVFRPGQTLTETLSGPSGTGTVATAKTMRYVQGVSTTGNTASGVEIGTGDVFGFPYRVDNFGDIRVAWNSVAITANTGFTAADTTTATATTGDVRGTYAVQSTASNGSRVLSVWINVVDPDTEEGLYGVSQA